MDNIYFYISEGHEASGEAPVTFPEFNEKLWKVLGHKDHLNHMALGAAGEVGELIDAIKKFTIYDKTLDHTNVVEELGDLAFYMQGIMTALGITWEQIIQHNMQKLSKRYQNLTFSTQEAQDRADKVMQNIGDK